MDIFKNIEDPNHIDYNSMQPLHSNTPYHHPMLEYCQIKPRTKKYRCTKCKRVCCDKCFIIHIYNQTTPKLLNTQCIECFSKTQYKHKYVIIHLFFKTIFSDKDNNLEINIISLITNYSVDTEIRCGNIMGYPSCSNVIKLALQGIINTESELIQIHHHCQRLKKRIISLHALIVIIDILNMVDLDVCCFIKESFLQNVHINIVKRNFVVVVMVHIVMV